MLRTRMQKCIAALVLLIPIVSFAAVTVSVNGSNHTIPQTNEKGWGNNVTAWIQAISANTLQPNGGNFFLTAETDFGANFGLKSVVFKSRALNPAGAGVLRLGNTEAIGWRNAANSANLLLSVNADNVLTFNGNPLVGSSALTASRALVSDSGGVISASSVTATELGHVAGVTSAIQTQINARETVANVAAHTGATTSVHGIADTAALATLTGSQTLTNKTLTAPVISTISNTGTLTLPTSTDTLVGRATTDTLSNKTFGQNIVADANNTRDIGTSSTTFKDVHTSGFVAFGQIATPAAPAAGRQRLYFKADGRPYYIDSTGTERAVGSGSGSGGGATNLLTNPSLEDTPAATGWTSAAGTNTADTSDFVTGEGTRSLSIALTAVNGTVISQSVTPAGGALVGNNLESGMFVKTSATTVQVCALQGTNEVACNNVPPTNNWQWVTVNHAAPSSGTIGVRLKTSGSTTATVKIDGGYVGLARNVGAVAQATMIGAARYIGATSCGWTRTSTSWGNFAADTDCSNATLSGSASAPATKIPGITFSNLPPGEYLVVANGSFYAAKTDTGASFWRLSDGTNSTNPTIVWNGTTGAGVGSPTFSGRFSYSVAQSSVTIQIQAKGESANVTAGIAADVAGDKDLEILVYRFPTQAETSYRPDLVPIAPTVQRFTSGSGTYTLPTNPRPTWIKVLMVGGGGGGAGSGTASGGNGGSGNASTFGSSFLTANGGAGAVYTGAGGGGGTATIGSGAVGATLQGSPGTSSGYAAGGAAIGGGLGGSSALGGGGQGGNATGAGTAGTANTGAGGGGGGSGTTATSFGGAGGGGGGYVEAIVMNPAASYAFTVGTGGAGGIAGTSGVAGGAGGSGVIIVEEYYNSVSAPLLVGSVTSNSPGMERVERANVTCSSSSSVISQSGSWISSIGNVASGQCAITIPSGVFSSTPTCTGTVKQNVSNARYSIVNATGPTSVVIGCADNVPANCSVFDFSVICMGPR